MANEKQARGGARRSSGAMGLWQATAIGVGGMIGAGIFSVMGVAARIAGTAAFLAFALSGLLAFVCAWSFARRGAVNLAHLRLARETGASRLVVAIGLAGCIAVLGVLLRHLHRNDPKALAVLALLVVGCFAGEAVWRLVSRGRGRAP